MLDSTHCYQPANSRGEDIQVNRTYNKLYYHKVVKVILFIIFSFIIIHIIFLILVAGMTTNLTNLVYQFLHKNQNLVPCQDSRMVFTVLMTFQENVNVLHIDGMYFFSLTDVKCHSLNSITLKLKVTVQNLYIYYIDVFIF